MKTYPIFLVELDRARCVVVGGGDVAARKVAALRHADADVVVISPTLCGRLERLVAQDGIKVLDRDYARGDLQDAFLVVAATDNPDVNQEVWEEATARGLLINVVDDPEHCNFIAPSVVRRGPLTLAISTSGRCPALSRHLRRQLEQEFGPAYTRYVQLLGDLRDRAVDGLSLDERRVFWQQIFESEVLSMLVSGQREEARQRAETILRQNLTRET